MLSNLPPGVTNSMIDNNFDEGAWEELIDDIYATKVRMGNGDEILITPEEARERWESQPKLKEFYSVVFPALISFALNVKEVNSDIEKTEKVICDFLNRIMPMFDILGKE